MPKTTGIRGIYIYVRLQPRWTSYQGAQRGGDGRARAGATAARADDRGVVEEERGARVSIDYNQNAPHKTIFGAWSVRARPGAQVSTPLN